MSRNVLLLIEPTPSAQVAKQLAGDIVRQGDYKLTALEINEISSGADDGDLAVSPHMLHLEELEELMDRRSKQYPDKESRNYFPELPQSMCDTKVVSGAKYAVLCQELERHDLAIIGRDGNFVEHWTYDAKEIINLLLDYQARPLIITPSSMQKSLNNSVLIVDDGGAATSRAIQLFVLMGLSENRDIHVMSVSRKKQVAEFRVAALSGYLQHHGISSQRHAIQSRDDIKAIVSDMIKQTQPSLVVSGAFGTHGWRRSLFGSLGDYLTRYCPVPLFTCQ